jgi:hypothetical protein
VSINITLNSGYSLKRWQKGLTVMLEKKKRSHQGKQALGNPSNGGRPKLCQQEDLWKTHDGIH